MSRQTAGARIAERHALLNLAMPSCITGRWKRHGATIGRAFGPCDLHVHCLTNALNVVDFSRQVKRQYVVFRSSVIISPRLSSYRCVSVSLGLHGKGLQSDDTTAASSVGLLFALRVVSRRMGPGLDERA